MVSRVIRCFALGASAMVMGGCVLDDIHEEMQASNAVMLRAEQTISESSGSLTRLEGQLDSILEQNLALQEKLAEQQVVLTSIDGSLKRLDEHLLALRQMMDAIDDRIPFVSFGAEEEEEAAPSEDAGEPARLPLDSDGLPTVRTAPPPSEEPTPSPDQR